jgi:transketolase
MDANAAKVYVLLGDGELQEGQVWEAAMFAAHRQLDNLVAIVDYNGLQIDGTLDSVVALGDIAAKFEAFGWTAVKCDGHDVKALHVALTEAAQGAGGPVVVIADTIKGKGVSFMENQSGWHGKAPNADECACALGELEARDV